METVKLWEEYITLPTLGIGPFNPQPQFDTYNGNWFHPYPLPYAYQQADKIKSDIEYLSITMENKYLKVIFLPHMGGRIYSIYDKVSKKELIHKPGVVNIVYQPGTSGGTYVGLGMELSIPNHHSSTNSRKREYSTFEKADGSKTVIIGEFELRYQMRWSMEFTLKPETAALYQKVIIHNQSSNYGRFRAWSNASVCVEDSDMEIFALEKEGWEHGGEFQAVSWPIWDGADFRYPNRCPSIVGTELKNVRNGMFAYYDHKNNFGMVHWADPGEIKGKKVWSWGESTLKEYDAVDYSDGQMYMEHQSGRDEDQETYEIVEPFATIKWDEVWYPVGKLDTVSNACETLTLAVLTNLEKMEYADNFNLKLQSTVPYTSLQIEVLAGNEQIGKLILGLKPGTIKNLTLKLNRQVKITDNIHVRISRDDLILLNHEIKKVDLTDKYIDKASDVSIPKIDRTADYVMKLAREKLRHFPQPKFYPIDDLLDETLQKDPGHAEALKLKAIFEYERGLFEQSIKTLKKSLERNSTDGEAYYYLGLSYYRTKQLEDAYFAFSDAIKFNWKGQAFFYLGLIAIANKNCQKALRMFGHALDHNADHIRARVYYSLLLDKADNKNMALQQIEQACQRNIFDPLPILAMFWLKKGTLEGFHSSKQGERIKKQLHGDIQTYYELILNFTELNMYETALELLKEAQDVCKTTIGIGMLPFYKYYIQTNMKNRVTTSPVTKAETIEYTFPFRFEEIEILKLVITENPDDKYAHYYLGLIKASLTRYVEGYYHIKKAADLGLEHPVVFNILGEMSQKPLKDIDQAISYFEKGLKLDKDNVFTLNYLADAFKIKKDYAKLEKIFKHPLTTKNMDLANKKANYLLGTQDYDAVIKFLKNEVNFQNMTQQLYPFYSEACIRKGTTCLRTKDYKQAITYFEKAIELPASLGKKIWKKRYNVRVEYWLGRIYKEMGNIEKAKEIWEECVSRREQYQDWTLGGLWNYGYWADRFYQGWALKELGRDAEAITYFDAVRAITAHKFKGLLTSEMRRELLEMAFNGLNDKEISTQGPGFSYLSKT